MDIEQSNNTLVYNTEHDMITNDILFGDMRKVLCFVYVHVTLSYLCEYEKKKSFTILTSTISICFYHNTGTYNYVF